jgi:hypothetical protein
VVAAFAAAGLIALLCAQTAMAGNRDRSHWSVANPGVVECGTFQDQYMDYYDVAETDVFDRAGSVVKVILHVDHHSDDTNSVTGLTLHEHGHFTETVDLVTGTDTVTGNQEIVNRPGTGVVIQDVGRVVYAADGNLVFFAGGRLHSQVLLGEQVWCDALR